MEYYFENEKEREEKAFDTPQRVKQMGGLDSGMKIFVEDYVYTYLYQYGRSDGGREKLAALVGRHYVVNGQETVVISGTIQEKRQEQAEGTADFGEEMQTYFRAEAEKYFPGMGIVGWAHCQPGFGAFLMGKDEETHKEIFPERWQVLFALDTMDKLDAFYIYDEEGRGLRQAKGYFVYYDRNRQMQEYMLENSMVKAKAEEKQEMETPRAEERQERRRPTQEERMDAAKDIRRVLRKREEAARRAKKEHDRLLAAVSCVLCVVCVSLGVAVAQSLDRLRTVETELMAMRNSYQTLAQDFEGVKVQSVFAVQQEDKAEKQEEVTKKYKVESGDSLGYISRKFYGDHEGIGRIMAANGLENADMIYEGQVLWIPAE